MNTITSVFFRIPKCGIASTLLYFDDFRARLGNVFGARARYRGRNIPLAGDTGRSDVRQPVLRSFPFEFMRHFWRITAIFVTSLSRRRLGLGGCLCLTN